MWVRGVIRVSELLDSAVRGWKPVVPLALHRGNPRYRLQPADPVSIDRTAHSAQGHLDMVHHQARLPHPGDHL